MDKAKPVELKPNHGQFLLIGLKPCMRRCMLSIKIKHGILSWIQHIWANDQMRDILKNDNYISNYISNSVKGIFYPFIMWVEFSLHIHKGVWFSLMRYVVELNKFNTTPPTQFYYFVKQVMSLFSLMEPYGCHRDTSTKFQ